MCVAMKAAALALSLGSYDATFRECLRVAFYPAEIPRSLDETSMPVMLEARHRLLQRFKANALLAYVQQEDGSELLALPRISWKQALTVLGGGKIGRFQATWT